MPGALPSVGLVLVGLWQHEGLPHLWSTAGAHGCCDLGASLISSTWVTPRQRSPFVNIPLLEVARLSLVFCQGPLSDHQDSGFFASKNLETRICLAVLGKGQSLMAANGVVSEPHEGPAAICVP